MNTPEVKSNSDPFLSDEDIDLLKRTTLKQFAEDQAETFIKIAQRTRLDPFSRQIYATRRMSHGNVTLVTVTGIQGLTALAERTGQYNGCQIFWSGPDGVWKDEWLQEEFPAAAKCIVHHKGHLYPEVGIARWNSYVGRQYNNATKRWEVSDFWEKMPDLMLAKVAKALALRGAFPDHLSGLYATEELDQSIGDQVNDEVKVAQNRKKEEELLKAAAAKGIKVIESQPVKKPTPAEAVAPAPEPPQEPSPQVQAPAPKDEPPDDLDMGGEPPQPPPAETAGSPAESAKPWADHVIGGLRNEKFLGRKVGDLSVVELQAIEEKWLPKVQAVWDTVKAAQKEDAQAFIAAIAYYKMEKPW